MFFVKKWERGIVVIVLLTLQGGYNGYDFPLTHSLDFSNTYAVCRPVDHWGYVLFLVFLKPWAQ